LDAIIRLNPKFTQARLQKSKILAKEGQFTEAKEETKRYLNEAEKVDPSGLELVSLRKWIAQNGWLTEVRDSPQESNLKAAESALAAARKAHKKSQHQACVEHATRALEVGPNSLELREIRLDCEEGLGDVDAVIGDLR
jgi:DnaJ family protein C protein 3